jgi:hypothetical protein
VPAEAALDAALFGGAELLRAYTAAGAGGAVAAGGLLGAVCRNGGTPMPPL